MVGRLLIALGAILLVAGLLLTYTNVFSYLRLGRLPGDLTFRRGNASFYIPLGTSILLSIVLTPDLVLPPETLAREIRGNPGWVCYSARRTCRR